MNTVGVDNDKIVAESSLAAWAWRFDGVAKLYTKPKAFQ
jgi:hypothetical protein